MKNSKDLYAVFQSLLLSKYDKLDQSENSYTKLFSNELEVFLMKISIIHTSNEDRSIFAKRFGSISKNPIFKEKEECFVVSNARDNSYSKIGLIELEEEEKVHHLKLSPNQNCTIRKVTIEKDVKVIMHVPHDNIVSKINCHLLQKPLEAIIGLQLLADVTPKDITKTCLNRYFMNMMVENIKYLHEIKSSLVIRKIFVSQEEGKMLDGLLNQVTNFLNVNFLIFQGVCKSITPENKEEECYIGKLPKGVLGIVGSYVNAPENYTNLVEEEPIKSAGEYSDISDSI